MTRLAWIGLGNMGRGMAKNLITKGDLKEPLILHNRTIASAERLRAEVGDEAAAVAKTIEEAVSADLIFTCVANDQAIEDTMDSALKTDVGGKVFVDCTTVHPETTKALAAKVTAKGAQYLSMTVLGSPAMAAAGQLVCILSGPAKAAAFVRPYTTGVIGSRLVEMGDEDSSKADLLKLIANTFILNVNQVVAEGLAFAEKATIEPQKLQELLIALFGAPYALYSQRMLGGDYHRKEAQVPVEMALKDAHHAQKIANDVGANLPSLDLAESNLQELRSKHGAGIDSSAVYGIIREKCSLPFAKQ